MLVLLAVAPGCANPLPDGTGSSVDTSTGDTTLTMGSTTIHDSASGTSVTSVGPATVADDTTQGMPDVPAACDPATMDCSPDIDVLIVVDNSGTMGEEQLRLTRSLLRLVERLEDLTDVGGMPLPPDVNVMVTTTDDGNPLCEPFQPRGYEPAHGAPIGTSCTSRLQDFTSLTGDVLIPEACEAHCPQPVEPDDAFIHFDASGDNVPDSVRPADVDGDGDLDSPAAQALACIGPQGINGCGYESQLESMLKALDPDAQWNQDPTPFLREGAMVAIVLVTDETDCSIEDFSIMEDPAVQSINPNSGMPEPSSAICWNAGMSCTGPDAMGVFSSCEPQEGGLQEISRYTSFLVDELRGTQGKEVVMLEIVGVPPVTAHSPEPPYQPTSGGAFDLVYRNWVDGPWPAGDILPDEWADGVTAADKQFDFGIGPGCTGTDAMGDFTSQALPPGRMLEVCQALDYVDDATGEQRYRCCIESICDQAHDAAADCLVGLIQDAVVPGG
jgi:hypothetical protein